MKKIIAILSLLSIGLFSQDKPRLQEDEIKRAGKVDFQNRNRHRAENSTRSEQENIGKILASKMLQNSSKEHEYKGIIVKRFPSKDSKLFGADIIQVSNDTSYGHINSILRIVSGYVQDSFDFSEENSDTIALYILYYNGMYRKEKGYFESKYTPEVNESISDRKVGIAKNYREWPGNTQIVVPLELSVIRGNSQEIILDELETEVDKIIDSKKNGSIDSEKIKEIIEDRKTENKELIKVAEEKKKENPDTTEKKSPEIKPETKPEPTRTEKPVEPTKKGEIVTKPETKPEPTRTEKPTEPVKKDEIVVKPETKPEPSRIEKPSEPKNEMAAVKDIKPKKEDTIEVKELKKENENLKAKEKEKEEKSDNVIGEKILFLRLIAYEDDGHYTNELWMLDAVNAESLYKSPYTNICGKEFHVIPGAGVVVIGFDGKRPKERVHRLVLLDEDKLSQKQVSKQEIFWRSQIIYRDNKIYAFEKYNDKVYFSRFNTDMSLEVRTSEPVNTNSEVSFFKDKIFLTGKQSDQEETVIRVLKRDDLTILKTLKPVEKKK